MLITIAANAAAPVFDQVADQIAAQVAAGQLKTGERLPSARDLADALGVNVHTVLHAYQRLRDDGIIELRRGRGAVVTGSEGTDRLHSAVRDAVAEARASGIGVAGLIALIRREDGAWMMGDA